MGWFDVVEDIEKFHGEMEVIKLKLLNKEMPEKYPDDISKYMPIARSGDLYVNRSAFISISSFALVSKIWLNPLSKFIGDSKCLEIMSGRGLLSKGLMDYGVDIIATDDFSWHWGIESGGIGKQLEQNDLWCDVQNLDCISAIEEYGPTVDYIICSWPYMNNNMYKSLIKMREVNPKCRLIYIGELWGNCADDDFCNSVNLIKDNMMFNIAAKKFQSWNEVRDELYLGK